jgi:hypothetical protein
VTRRKPEPQVFTLSELVKRWRCDRHSLLAAIEAGKLKAFRIGARNWRVTAAEVERLERAA